MRLTSSLAGLATALLLTFATWADDKEDKKGKIPPLTLVGVVEGEIVYVEHGADRMTLKVKEITKQWQAGGGGGPGVIGRFNNNRGTYVNKEELKDKTYNLSPDIKVRLMNVPAADEKEKGKKKPKPPTEKEKAEKDPDYKLGGQPGKKSQLAKGQYVRVSLGVNNDKVNPQIYGMAVFVLKDSK